MRLNFKRNSKYWMIVVVLLAVDTLGSWIAFSRSLLPYYEAASVSLVAGWVSFAGIQLLWIILFYMNGRYRADPTLSRFDEIQTLFKITLVVSIIAVISNELVQLPILLPSSALLQYWIILVACLTVGRLSVRQVQKFFLGRGYGKKNALVVGVNQRARRVAKQLDQVVMGYRVVGFVTPHSDGEHDGGIDGVPVVGSVDTLKESVLEHQISEVVIALDKPNHDRLLDIMTIANGSPISLKIIPDMYEVVSGLAKTEQLYGVPLVQINPEIISKPGRFLKRLIDIVMAITVLVPLFPVWVILGFAIKLDTKGPVLYRQLRTGLNGRRFVVNKFRTMVHNAESLTGPVWAKQQDPRITKVGRFLRRFRLDEVPQFINVVKGDMSVVGPRPERPYFVGKLIDEFPFYYRRYKIRPGITGWAQIKHSYDSTVEDVRQKLRYDFFYIENLSLSLDFLIMLRTAAVMLSGKGH